MSNFFLPILLIVGAILWKVLDYFQLPNTFSILLIIFTAISGLLWCHHRFVVKPKRERQIARAEQRTGKALTEEEKRQIEPISEGAEFLSSLFPVLGFVLILRSFVFEPFQIPSGSMEPTLRVGDFLVVEKYAYGIKDPIFQNTLIEIGKPQRGDVIVFKAPPQPNIDYIKRIIGVGGDRVQYNALDRKITLIYGNNGVPCNENCTIKQFTYSEPKSDESSQLSVGNNPDGTLIYGPNPLELTETGDVEHQIYWDPANPVESFRYRDYAHQDNYVTEWIVPQGEYFVMGDSRDRSYDGRYWGFVPEKNIVGKATFIWLSLKKKQGEWPTGIRTERFFQSIK